MKKLLCTALILVSTCSHAIDGNLQATAAPRMIRLVDHDSASAYFNMRPGLLPIQSFGKPMTLEGLSWKTTYYPSSDLKETVEICYYPDGYNRKKPAVCQTVTPDSEGTSTVFSNLRFSHLSSILITHKVSGGRQIIKPAGKDAITIRYRY